MHAKQINKQDFVNRLIVTVLELFVNNVNHLHYGFAVEYDF